MAFPTRSPLAEPATLDRSSKPTIPDNCLPRTKNCQCALGDRQSRQLHLWPAAGWAYRTVRLLSAVLLLAFATSPPVAHAGMLETTGQAVSKQENIALEQLTTHASRRQTPATTGYLVVTGTLDRRLSGPLLLDTGASFCLISPATALRLGVDPLAGLPITVSTANGDATGRLVNLKSVTIDSAEVTDVPTVVLSTVQPPLLGVVGLSFLNHFRYTIDSRNGMFSIHRD